MASKDKSFEELVKEAPPAPAAGTVSLVGTLAQSSEAGKFVLSLQDGTALTLEIADVQGHEVLGTSVGQTIVRVDVEAEKLPPVSSIPGAGGAVPFASATASQAPLNAVAALQGAGQFLAPTAFSADVTSGIADVNTGAADVVNTGAADAVTTGVRDVVHYTGVADVSTGFADVIHNTGVADVVNTGIADSIIHHPAIAGANTGIADGIIHQTGIGDVNTGIADGIIHHTGIGDVNTGITDGIHTIAYGDIATGVPGVVGGLGISTD
jgi:hypothetical protein